MGPETGINRILGVENLRKGFLEHTRRAYAMLPGLARPRIIDVGCGDGLVTIELARLSEGEVVGIDIDGAAILEFRRRIEDSGLSARVTAIEASIHDSGLPEGSFDLAWEEGVLHLLDSSRSLPAIRRLLRPGGFLVMHETLAWFDGAKDQIEAAGFRRFGQVAMPGLCWWTDYYAPLEKRIGALPAGFDSPNDLAALAQYKREIAKVKANPELFDCAFLVMRKGREESRQH